MNVQYFCTSCVHWWVVAVVCLPPAGFSSSSSRWIPLFFTEYILKLESFLNSPGTDRDIHTESSAVILKYAKYGRQTSYLKLNYYCKVFTTRYAFKLKTEARTYIINAFLLLFQNSISNAAIQTSTYTVAYENTKLQLITAFGRACCE